MTDPVEIIEEETHLETKYVEWKIPNFNAIYTIDTPTFSFIGGLWSVEISRRHYGGTFISLFLFPKGITSSRSVTFTLGMKYLEKEINQQTLTCDFDTVNRGYGHRQFYSREKFLNLCENASIIPFTVYCYLKYRNKKQLVADAESQTSLYDIPALCRDFDGLFASGRQSDVIIKVHEREFKTHKSILAGRSPVFAAMFDHDMLENNDGVVLINDCDPDAFHIFLQYIYTGNLKYESTEGLISLYTIADKYSVTDLKETCEHFVRGELSVDNACDFFVLAEKHNDTQLKTFVEEFLMKNLRKAVSTNNWRIFMSEHSSFAQDILIKSFSGEIN